VGRPVVIAIDGPTAAGKTTVGRILAEALRLSFLDTGLFYRALTFAALQARIRPTDGKALAQLAGTLDLRIEPSSVADGRSNDVYVDGEDVSLALHSPEVEASVARVSPHPEVRTILIGQQRRTVRSPGAVVVGRDIGTNVFPDADLKIYLDADPVERSRRRLIQQGRLAAEANLSELLRLVRERDRLDSTRPLHPLQPAPDAVIVHTDQLTPEAVVGSILQLWQARKPRGDTMGVEVPANAAR
jgi:cytidylate kinase